MKIKAAVLYKVKTPLVVEEVDLDDPKPGEVLVKVGAAGICRSDWHFMVGEAPMPTPVILGHEGAGVVERTGKGVTRVKPGDRVILSFVSPCGQCPFCATGRPNLCDVHVATFGNMMDGTKRHHKNGKDIVPSSKLACFASHSVVPEVACVPCPNDLPLGIAAVIGCCVTTGVGAAINTARVEPGSTVAVVGCGGVGLNVIMGARLSNALKIIAVDINDASLEFATRFGATHTVNPKHGDAVAMVKKLTGGLGADYTFEVYGGAETCELAFNMARKGGTATIVGIAPTGDMPHIDATAIVRQEKTMKGSYYGSARMYTDMPRMVELYRSGKLDLDALITRHYKLDDINKAYQDLNNGAVGRGIIDQF
ncbi:MAG: Zn-dependent alcohol dehydrogenase [SAR202 cluster bacterium]|nr:Zn-dependent alcohol dehydrogenase [SAR202 cluster bacterium]